MTYLIGIVILVIIVIAALITMNLKAASPENRKTGAPDHLPEEEPERNEGIGSPVTREDVQQEKMNDVSYRQALKELQPLDNETYDTEKPKNELNDNLYRNVLKNFSENDKR